jgi:hypothetical protein
VLLSEGKGVEKTRLAARSRSKHKLANSKRCGITVETTLCRILSTANATAPLHAQYGSAYYICNALETARRHGTRSFVTG